MAYHFLHEIKGKRGMVAKDGPTLGAQRSSSTSTPATSTSPLNETYTTYEVAYQLVTGSKSVPGSVITVGDRARRSGVSLVQPVVLWRVWGHMAALAY